MSIETDGALILGAGIAGLFTALKLAPMPCLVLAGIAARPVGLQRLGAGRHRRGGGRRRQLAVAMPPTPWRRARACATRRSSIWWRGSPGPHRRPAGLWRAVRPQRRRLAGAGPRSGPFPRPHRACEGRSAPARRFPRTLAARAAATPSHHAAGRLSCRRTGDGKWPRHRPVRPLRLRAPMPG